MYQLKVYIVSRSKKVSSNFREIADVRSSRFKSNNDMSVFETITFSRYYNLLADKLSF